MNSRLARRDFLHASSAAAIGAALGSRSTTAADAPAAAKLTADQFIPGKDKRLIVHSTKTGEIETPLELLREHRFTPQELLFVRNNQKLADTLSLEPARAPDWTIDVQGLVDAPRTLTVGQLEQLPQRELEVVWQCSGNSRTRHATTAKVEGVPWGNGAMANVLVRGVPLAAALEACGARINPDARYVTIEGRDVPLLADAPDFEHSLPLADALKKSLLVLAINGQPLAKAHGGPVRIVTPGYYATMNVKWVSRLTFAAGESTNHHHVERYRSHRGTLEPGATFKSTLDNSDPHWNMRIKSVIFSPLEGAATPAGPVPVRGVAWNDGNTKIVAVEVSIDDGASWRRAELTPPSSPYGWYGWKSNVAVPRGDVRILSRAFDASGNSQPLDGAVLWNPAGYCWNGVDAVRIRAT